MAQIASTNGLSMQASGLSRELHEKSSQKFQQLQGLSGADFDRAYLQAQVEHHREFLDVLNQRLLPGAETEALLHELQALRDSLQEHLAHAEQLAASGA